MNSGLPIEILSFTPPHGMSILTLVFADRRTRSKRSGLSALLNFPSAKPSVLERRELKRAGAGTPDLDRAREIHLWVDVLFARNPQHLVSRVVLPSTSARGTLTA